MEMNNLSLVQLAEIAINARRSDISLLAVEKIIEKNFDLNEKVLRFISEHGNGNATCFKAQEALIARPDVKEESLKYISENLIYDTLVLKARELLVSRDDSSVESLTYICSYEHEEALCIKAFDALIKKENVGKESLKFISINGNSIVVCLKAFEELIKKEDLSWGDLEDIAELAQNKIMRDKAISFLENPFLENANIDILANACKYVMDEDVCLKAFEILATRPNNSKAFIFVVMYCRFDSVCLKAYESLIAISGLNICELQDISTNSLSPAIRKMAQNAISTPEWEYTLSLIYD